VSAQQSEELRAASSWYRSFLVRVWHEEDEQDERDAAGWQAEVKQIQSGERWSFSSQEALIAFLHRKTNEVDRVGSRGE
jgi:hypothetical protein